MRPAGRLGLQASAVALWGMVILIVGALVGTGETAGQGFNRAGLVITDAEGETQTSCVEFAEEELTGAELLRRSGIPIVYGGSGSFGQGVCSIDGSGCNDPSDCFCQCRGADCAYWAYFSMSDGRWRFQAVGASQRRVRDGDVDGWVWGPGSDPPPPVTFGEVCPLDAAPTALPPTRVSVPRGDDATEAPAPSQPVATQKRPLDAEGDPEATAEAALEEQRQVLAEETEVRREETVVDAEDKSGGGTPAGLIAFGLVAGLLGVTIGGLALRRRLRG